MTNDLAWYRPLQHLNLNRLLGFMAVAEMNSFRAAAERIHLSQSALSVQVRQLEVDLGVSLMHRTTRSVKLTEEGRKLYAVIKRLSTDLVEVASDLKGQAALHHGVVSVAVLPSLTGNLLPEIMTEFLSLHPGIRLQVRDADSRKALELIRDGDVDIGVLTQSAPVHEFRFEPLFEDEFMALVPAKDHPVRNRARVKLKELAKYPLLLSPRGVDMREALEKLFRSAGSIPQPLQEITNGQALVAMVGFGFGATVMPRLALRGLDLSRCRVLKIEPRASRQIGVVSARNRSDSPAIVALRQFMQLHAARISAKSAGSQTSTGI
jgi:LysR family transcriptional regulator, carnitine catabolism transcriptional activator